MRCITLCVTVLLVLAALAAKGASDMPMLNWMGREKAARATKDVVMKILREEKSLGYRVGGSRSCATGTAADARERVPPVVADAADARERVPPEGILVHGDNLEALKALLPFYAGEVKCIYIDPPYNTGSAFEHYDDNLEHSTWLNMMYPRLKLLREFLREDGSIWISIDDDECHYLKVICDEIFGRKNFIANIVWQKRTSPDMRSAFSDGHDHILLYVKNKELFKQTRNKLPLSEKQQKAYKNPDNDPRGPWTSADYTATGFRPNQMYKIVTPGGKEYYPPDGVCWKNIESIYKELVADNRIWFGTDGNSMPRRKTFLSEHEGVTPWSWWSNDEVGHNQEAKKEIVALFGSPDAFETPKPERLIQRILTIATNPGDLVMDSFLGSGTTAAVAHKMGRRWIGIEMGEHAKTHCAVRMKKVVDGEQGGISKAVKWSGGGGFRFYELGEPLLDERGQIAESIPYEVLAAHVWWQDTGTAWGASKGAKGTVLGIHEGVAYALLYNGILHDRSVNGGNVLTRQTLGVIKDDMDGAMGASRPTDGELPYRKLVVYGEWNKLGEERLKEEKIEFRQTPYDVVTRR